jgi:nucleotide-binding universal stress UspA family protein
VSRQLLPTRVEAISGVAVGSEPHRYKSLCLSRPASATDCTTRAHPIQGRASVRTVDATGDGPAVLVAHDGAEATRQALQVACNLAGPTPRSLTAVVATRRSPRYGETMAEVSESLTRSEQTRRRLLNEVEAALSDRGIAARNLLTPGRTVPELLRAARRDHYDVIVLPASGGVASIGLRLAKQRAQRHAATVVLPTHRDADRGDEL